MGYSHILWDFNGTLLDDVQIGIDSINVLLKAQSLPLLESREDYRAKFRFPIREYYRKTGLDFSVTPYEVLAHQWIREYRSREGSAPLFPGAREVLEYVKAAGIPQILFSATQRDMLMQQVEALGIGDYFSHIIGADDIYAAGKTALGKAWVEQVRPPSALLVGDTEHDAQSAREMGIDCILVNYGHRPATELKKTGLPVFSSLAEVREFLFR